MKAGGAVFMTWMISCNYEQYSNGGNRLVTMVVVSYQTFQFIVAIQS